MQGVTRRAIQGLARLSSLLAKDEGAGVAGELGVSPGGEQLRQEVVAEDRRGLVGQAVDGTLAFGEGGLRGRGPLGVDC
jgi:hypothetical protein